PKTGHRAYAVVQLRQDNALGTLWNMVGFQTKLKHGEQARIFRTIPGLAGAEFASLGCGSPARSRAARATSRARPSACSRDARLPPSASVLPGLRRRRPRPSAL